MDVVIKSVCSVIVAVVIEELAGLIANIKFYGKGQLKRSSTEEKKI